MNMFKHLRNDLPASVVVFFVAVPLCLGIALASGAPLLSGLIAGIIGGLVVGTISGSPLGVSGPAAGLAVIVLNAIGELGWEAFLAAVVIAGGLQVGLGVIKAGVLGYFFPSSVIRGMLAGIGLIIILKQIPHAVGYDQDPMGEMQYHQPDGHTTLDELSYMLDGVDVTITIVAAISMGILLLWQRLGPKHKIFQLLQGPLVAVGFGIAYQALATRFFPDHAISAEHLVAVPVAGGFAEMADLLTTPDWSAFGMPAVWVTALTVAVVGSLETLLCLDATDKLDPHGRVTPANRELVAQGVGNTLSGLIGGLPITQVIVRSSANIQSGAHTKMSAILHGGFLLIAVVLLPQLLNMVPLAVLATILFIVGFKLASPSIWKTMWGLGRQQFIPFTVTVAGIVFTDLLTGIGLGLAVAIAEILRANYLNSHFLHIEESDDSGRHKVRLTLAEEVTFLNKGAILRELDNIADDSHVIIDATNCVAIAYDVNEIIEEFTRSAPDRRITVEIRNGDNGASLRDLQQAV